MCEHALEGSLHGSQVDCRYQYVAAACGLHSARSLGETQCSKSGTHAHDSVGFSPGRPSIAAQERGANPQGDICMIFSKLSQQAQIERDIPIDACQTLL